MSSGYSATSLFGVWVEILLLKAFLVKIFRLYIVRISALRWTEFHQNHKDPMREIQRFSNLGDVIIYVKMISKLYTIISNKLWDLSLYFWDLYNRWVLASQQKALGFCKCDQSKGGDTGELQRTMVPSQNNWVESP